MHLHVHVISTCTLSQSDWFYQVLQSCHIQVSRLIPFNSNFLVLLSTKKKFYFQPLLHEVHLSPLSTLQLASVSQNFFRFCNPTLELWRLELFSKAWKILNLPIYALQENSFTSGDCLFPLMTIFWFGAFLMLCPLLLSD